MKFWILIWVLIWAGSGSIGLLRGQRASSESPSVDEAQQQATIDRALVDLRSGSPETRKGAVMLLGKYQTPEAQNAVLEALSDEDPEARFAAVVSVLERKAYESVAEVETVMSVLDDPKVEIRRAVSTSIGKLASLRIQILTRRLMQVNSAPARQLPMLPISIRLKMVNAFLDTDVVVRRNMVSRYNFLGISVPSEVFARLLQDEDLEVRSTVLPLAARHMDVSLFVEKAAPLADDESPVLRLSLIRELYPRDAYKPISLLQRLTQDEVPEVAIAAELQLFNNDPDLKRYKSLAQRLEEGALNANQRERLVQLVGRLKEKEERDRFALRFMESSEDALRVIAARHLFNFKLEERYPEKLTALLGDSSQAVRSQVTSHYSRHREKLQSLDWNAWQTNEYKDVRLALVRLAIELPREEAGEVLFDLLLDDEIDVRVAALTMYSRLRLDGFERILEMTLRDENVVIQKRAVQNIIQIMGEAGRTLLEEYSKDEGAPTPLSAYIDSQLKARQ